MYQPTTRLLTVLELLQARPMMSGSELARRLEVDGRTVRRYVMMLQDMGIPVEAVQGRYGGYRLRPGFKLPPLLFTEEEALAVTLGLLAARRLGLSATAPAMEGALAKVERVLPIPVAERIRAVQDTIAFTEAAPAAAPASIDALFALSAAVHREQRVWLRYRGGDGAESEREFEPYGLVFHYGRWYVVGFDRLRSEMRTFRVDRVLEVEPRDATFERPAGFDAADYLARTLATLPWGFELEVLLETTIEEARWRVPSHRGVLEEADGGVLLRLQSDDLAIAARYLVWLACPFVVLRPVELRDELRRLADELSAIAAQGDGGASEATSAPGPRG